MLVKSELSLQRVTGVVEKPVDWSKEGGTAQRNVCGYHGMRMAEDLGVSECEGNSLELPESSWTVRGTTRSERFLYVVGRVGARGLAY